jgi:hypothetical protein
MQPMTQLFSAAKWLLQPSSTRLFLSFSFVVLISALISADPSVGPLSTQTVWDSVDFWRRLQISGYLLVIVWTCFTLFGYSSAKAIYIVSLLLDFLLPESLLRDSAHRAFIFLDVYKLFGYKTGPSTNPNVAWTVLLFLFSSVLLIRLLIQAKGSFNRFAKVRFLFFPFFGIASVLILTLIMHETIIGGMLNEAKTICASDAEAMQNDEPLFNARCAYRDENCAKLTLSPNGTASIKILNKPERSLALSMNDPSGDHPADKDDKSINDLILTAGNAVLNQPSNYHWSVNGFEVYSTCSIKLDTRTALVSIDTHDFSLRFAQAQMRFHRLVAIASWVWIISLMLHLLRLPAHGSRKFS